MVYNKWNVAILIVALFSILSVGVALQAFSVNHNTVQLQSAHKATVYLFEGAPNATVTTNSSSTTIQTSTSTSTNSSSINTTTLNLTTINENVSNSTTIIQSSDVTNPLSSLTLSQNMPLNVAMDSNQSYTFQASASAQSSYHWSYINGIFSVVSGCSLSSSTCELQATNVSASYQAEISVYANTTNSTSAPASWNVTINPQLANVYANIGQISQNGTDYTLVSAVTGGTPPYRYTWGLYNLTEVSGCGTLTSNNTCTVTSLNSSNQSYAILTVVDNATIPVNVTDWHVSSVIVNPFQQFASSESSSTFTVTTTLDGGAPKDIISPSITYSWSSTNGLSVSSCPTSGNLVITCNIANPVVSSLEIYSIKVIVTHAQAIIVNQTKNPDSHACTYLSGTSPHQEYTCTYSIGASGSSILYDYPLLTTILSANRTVILPNQKVMFTNTTTGGSGGNAYYYTLNNSAGVTQTGNKFSFTIAGKYNVTLHVQDSINEKAQSSVVIAVNESLQPNQTKILYPGIEVSGIPVFSRDQVITDTDTGAMGGVPPYTYEWFVALPNSVTFYPANCGAGATGPIPNPNPCKFATNSSSPLGQYHFQLQVTDNTVPPGSVTSSLEPFNLNASLKIISLIANRTLISGDQLISITNTTVNGTGGKTFTYTLLSVTGNSMVGTLINEGNNKFGFTAPGTYNIALTVIDQSGENATANVTIQVNKPLETTLFENRSLISSGQWITFTNNTIQGTQNYQYSYTFSNTCNNPVQNSSNGNIWQFNNATTCIVTLHVQDATGELNSSSNTITITPPLTTKLVNESRLYISAGQSVTFTNYSTNGTGNDANTYFVNGVNTTLLSNGSIVFANAGTYTVTLGTMDISGEVANDLVGIQVTVTPPLETNLFANWTYISANQSVLFTNTTFNGTGSNVYSYNYYCDGVSNIGNIFTFADAGTCTVTLNVQDASGEVNSSSNTITVTPILTTKLVNESRLYISAGQSVNFTNYSTGGTGNDVNTYFVNGVIVSGNSIIFTNAGTYTVTLGTTDLTGEVANDLVGIQVTVTPPLTTTLFENRSLISSGQWISLSNTTFNGTGSYQYSYTFSNTCNNPVQNATNGNIWQFNNATTCTVTLHVTDASGEMNQSSNTVTVTPVLTTNLFANWTYISANQSVLFTNTTFNGTGSNVYSYNYVCTGATNVGNIFTFANAGTCTVTLNVQDASGEFNSSSNTITVTPILTTKLVNESRLYISAGQSVTFTNYSTNGTGNDANTYFVNGVNTTLLSNGSIVFANAGTYTVTLGTTDLTGEVANDLVGIQVTVTPPLEINLIANRTYISANQSVLFTNTTFNGTGSNVYTYDYVCTGATNVGNIFTFTSAGTCTITLNVQDASGEFNSSSNTITVTGPLETKLVNESRLYISAGQSVTFTNNSTEGTGSDVNTYFVNGVNTTLLSNGSIVFANAGTYTVTLGTTDISGEVANDLVGIQVTVTPPLETNLIANRTYISANQSVLFTNTTFNGTGSNQYSYTFSNTCGNPVQNATNGNIWQFNNATTCTVTLHVTDASGEMNQSSNTITITPPLELKLFSNWTLISQGQSIALWNTTSGGTGSNVYSYAINDITGVSQNANVLTFSLPGSYMVTLGVKDLSGETASSNVTIDVTNTLGIILFENLHVVIQNKQVTLTNTTSGGTGSNVYYYTVNKTNGVTFIGNKVSFADIGTYNVTIHVKDFSGETNQSSNIIVVDEPLLINESFTTTPLVSVGQLVKITNSGAVGGSGVPPYTYEWLYEGPHVHTYVPATMCMNITSLTCLFQTNSITKVGQYQFILQVTDSQVPKETTDSAAILITVTNALVIKSFSAIPNPINAGQSTTLVNTTLGGTGGNVYTYTLNNTSGVSQNGNMFTFANAGKYLATIYVVDQSGENATANTTITVVNPLTIELFNTSRLYISPDQFVTFTNTTSGGTSPYTWTYFINGVPASSSGGSITFPSAGNYVVTLGVTDTSGQTANSEQINVIVTAPLETSLLASITTISTNQSVTFTNITSGGTGSNVYSYNYDCDGVSNIGNIFTFADAGTCTVTLNVQDASGEVNSSSNTITITGPLVITSFVANRSLISAGQSVSFTNTTSGGTGSNVYSYNYDCDGVTNIGNTFTFADAGKCKITLNVVDQSGETNSTSTNITITAPLEITSFIPNESSISSDQTVLFTNTTSGGTGSNVYSYSVDCTSGGANSINVGNTITFTHSGTCTVTLNVSDLSGETNSTSTNITITAPLEITSLTPNMSLISAGQTVSFVNTTTGGTGSNVYSYSVDCTSGGANSVNVGNTITFTHAGTCMVTLNVADISGETNSSSTTITITPPLEFTYFAGNTTLIDAGQSVSFVNTTSGGTGSNKYSYNVVGPGSIVITGNSTLFQDPGSYTININVTDQSGETNTTSTTVMVNPKMVISQSITGGDIDLGQSATITGNVVGGTEPYIYNFTIINFDTDSVVFHSLSSPDSSNSYSVVFSPTSPGVYFVHLQVKDSVGAIQNDPDNIIVNQPILILSPSSTTLTTGQNETFTLSATNITNPISVELYNTSGLSQQGSNVILVPNSTNTITFTAGSNSGDFNFEAFSVITYNGIMYQFNSTLETLAVNIQSNGNGNGSGNGNGGNTGVSGSSGGSGNIGGSGGSFKPTVINGTNNVTVTNVTQLGSFNLQLCSTGLHVVDNYVTPNSTGITVNNVSYSLSLGEKTLLANIGSNCYVELVNVSYLPIVQSVTLLFTGQQNITITITNNTVATKQTVAKNPPATTTILPPIPQQAPTTQQQTTQQTAAPKTSALGSTIRTAIVDGIVLVVLLGIVFGVLAAFARKKPKSKRRKN